MDILNDIKDIFIKNHDINHRIEITVSSNEVKIYIISDDLDNHSGNREILKAIPIIYDLLERYVYIDAHGFCEKSKSYDFGISYEEVIIIKQIMEYFNKNADCIDALCSGYDYEERF